MRRLTNCFSFQRPRSRICACSSCSSAMRSKQSQNSCEVKRSGAKPHWERRMVRSYQSATSVFGPGWQTRWMAAKQQIMRRRGAGARGGPQRLEQLKNAGALGGQPEGAGQAEVQSGGFQRKGSGSVSDERGHLFGATELSLVNNARLAVDACAFDDVVVEMIAFLLGDERCHIG